MSDEAPQDQVAEAVSQLRESVEGLRDGMVDETKVRSIAEEVLAANAAAGRQGYVPPDVDPEVERRGELSGTPRERLRQIHDSSASVAARLSGRDVEDVKRFHGASDSLLLASTILQRPAEDLAFYENEYLPAVRAMDTQTAGEGAEYVPTGLSSSLIERVSLDLRLVSLFPEIQMPTNPFDIPGRAMSRQRGGRHVEQTADSGQTLIKKITPATRKVRLTAARFATEVLVSKDEEEDAIIAVMPFLEDEIVDYTVADLEDAAVNGDTAGTHRDSDVTLATDPRKNWNGLRKLAADAAAQRDGGADKLTVADLRANRGLMGKYGVRPDRLAHEVSIKSYIDLLSDANVITVDKYGPKATVLTGELGKVDGVPIVVSELAREDLNATGVYAAASTKTTASTVYYRGLARGIRRGMTVQLLKELYAEADQDGIIITTRQALESLYPGQPIVATTYNLAPGV